MSKEMLVFGGEFWNLKANFVFLYIKTHEKLWENWQASQETNIFPQPCAWIISQKFCLKIWRLHVHFVFDTLQVLRISSTL